MSAPDRRGLLQRDHESLSIRRQCQLLSVARSSIYRPPRPANDNDLRSGQRSTSRPQSTNSLDLAFGSTVRSPSISPAAVVRFTYYPIALITSRANHPGKAL